MPRTHLRAFANDRVILVAAVAGVATCDLNLGNVFQIVLGANTTIALTGVASSLTDPTTATSQKITFIIVQNASSAHTLTWPSNVHGGMTVSPTLSSINVQEFVCSNNGSDLYSAAAGVTGLTGGTP